MVRTGSMEPPDEGGQGGALRSGQAAVVNSQGDPVQSGFDLQRIARNRGQRRDRAPRRDAAAAGHHQAGGENGGNGRRDGHGGSDDGHGRPHSIT